jgi:hypothetical protein
MKKAFPGSRARFSSSSTRVCLWRRSLSAGYLLSHSRAHTRPPCFLGFLAGGFHPSNEVIFYHGPSRVMFGGELYDFVQACDPEKRY